MISLKKYLDEAHAGPSQHGKTNAAELLPATIAAYRSALREMGNCSLDACPALGEGLKQGLDKLGENLASDISREAVEAIYARAKLPPHPLAANGYLSVGCMPCTTRTSPDEDARAGRWRGRAKTECGIHTAKV